MRSKSRTLIYGDFRLIEREHPQVFAYTRTVEDEMMTVLCNMSGKEARLTNAVSGACVLRNMHGEMEERLLAPYEARVIRSRV